MNTRILASIIIGLCLISILIGIFNTTATKKAQQENVKESSKSFKNIFGSGGNKIALITLEGAITSEMPEGLIGGVNSAESVLRSFKKALKDNSVKGVLFRINSPGGTVAMSQEIYETILRLRKEKPVVVSMADVSASGGYYVSCAADRIFADPGTLTGSIGVIMYTHNVKGLLDQKLGIKTNVIKSGKFKDMASPYRPISPEETSLLQNIINDVYGQFVDAIIKGRIKREDKYSIGKTILTVEILKKHADGRIFTGDQAKKLGFVDQLGGIYDAQQAINEMAQSKFNLLSKDLPLIPYNKPTGIGDLLFNISESITPKKDVTASLLPFSAQHIHQPLFIWE